MNVNIIVNELQKLRLSGMASNIELQASQPTYIELPFEERLMLLIQAEATLRDNSRFQRLVKRAKLKVDAAPEDIDYRMDRGLDRLMVADLLTCEWVRRHQNVLITGKTGTGKTWLACALAIQAARKGYTVLYKRVPRILEELESARNDGSILKARAAIAKVNLLVLDDFGLTPMNAGGRTDLLELLDDRVGSAPTIMLGQMPTKDWHGFINDPAIADAILDRLLHDSHKIPLRGESMRKVTADLFKGAKGSSAGKTATA